MILHLKNEGHPVNEKRIGRVMPACHKPNASKPAKGHKIWP